MSGPRRANAALTAALALACLAAGGRALTPAAEPAFGLVIRAVNDAHRLGDAARVEGVAIEPVDARISLTVAGAPAVVHLRARGDDGPGTDTRWFRFAVDPPGALGPAGEAALARLLDESFPDDPFVSSGASGARPAPGEARFDRPRTLDDAVRLELAHTPADDEHVSSRAMFARVAGLTLALAAGLFVVARRHRR